MTESARTKSIVLDAADWPDHLAGQHAHEDSHPIIKSAEPGEDWSWCYIDNVAFVLE